MQRDFSRKITHLESSVLTQNKTQISKQQMNSHETSYQCHCYLLKRISRMHAILLWRFSDDSLKFVNNSSVLAFANNADMRMCSWVCVCVSVWACVGALVFFVRVRKCVLLERSFRQCRSSAFWMICRPLSCIYVALSFCCCLPLPPRCRLRALCWIFQSALGSFAVRFTR